MIDGTIFLNWKFFWPFFVGSLLLWAVFIWKEWTQRKEQRFWVKLMVSCVGIASLLAMALRPAHRKEALLGKGLLLTEGHRPEQLDSIRSLFRRIRTESYIPGNTPPLLETTDSLFVLGHGIQPFDMWQFKGKAVNFLGGKEPEGLVDVSHKEELLLGEELSIKVKYTNPKTGHWLILNDPGENGLDSIPLDDGEQQYVELGTNPKASGHFVYSLVEKDAEGSVVRTEPLPVKVQPREPLNIWMVTNFPTFETKYLKNFLAENGHSVLARTQLTKDRFKFEYFNREASPIYQMTAKALEDFDLIIMDTDSYLGLGPSSKSALEETIRERGTGLFIQPNAPFFKLSQRQSPFRFLVDGKNDATFGGVSERVEKYPYAFQDRFPLQPIILDSVAMAAYIPMEKGKMATSILQDTYHLILNGNQDLYAKLWTQLLNELVRQQEVETEWQALTDIPRKDQPFEFQLRTHLESPQVETDQGAGIPLLQDYSVSTLWNGTRYPRNVGWNHLELSRDSLSRFSYYVFDANDRKAVTQKRVLEANIRKFGQHEGFGKVQSATVRDHVPVSPLWFFVPFVLCMGWLWLEPKLSQ
ncbi:hypothetical protein [Flagellimonas amoyensis]|uniref:hypothetical protein n=1 Tax=Flagellimonas amoyensis TaxID=2169401 RepID=UPI000D39CEE4|nr:hypothetical protein [Allomuricauda amoyensis]